MRNLFAAMLLAGIALPLVPDAQAQADAGFDDDAIIVTARRVEESIQDVPIAIAAISGEDLARRSIANENDLQSAVPGLIVRQNGGANAFSFSIRGQSVDTYTNSPPSVLPYINEVQIVSHSSSTFYDMAGIQVLKGPQGTLFGRNTTGGAILFSTRKPGDEFGGYVVARGGNRDFYQFEGALDIPASEAVKLRLAASHKDGGGYIRDFYTDEAYGDNRQTSIRGTLEIGSGAFNTTTVAQYTDEKGTNTPFLLWSSNRLGGPPGEGNVVPDLVLNAATNPGFAAFNAARPARFQGNLQAAIALQNSLGPWVSLSDVYPYHKADQTWVMNTSELELGSDIKLKNIFGYNIANADDGQDYDGSPWPYFQVPGTLSTDGVKINPTAGFISRTKQVSNEFQVQGKAADGRLDYVLGVYFLDQKSKVESNLAFSSFGLFGDTYPPFAFAYTAQWKSQSIAGFAQASFAVTEKLNLTGGFRYTRDKTTMVQLPGSVWLFTPAFAANVPEVTRAKKPSWTVSLDYRVSPELMIYAAHRGSWRAGGFNYSVAPIPVTATSGGNLFLPETTKDIEIGLKYSGDGLGVPLTFNADFFHQWVENIQRAAYVSGANGVTLFTANVPEAQITGVEADFSVRASDNIRFGAAVNYTDARYTRNSLSITLPPDPTNVLRYGPFADVPKVSGTIFAEVTAPLGKAGNLALRGDLYSQGKMYFTNVADTLNARAVLPGYTLVNARLTLSEIMGSGVSTSVSARNIFNKRYYVGGNAANSATLPNTVNAGVPRMIAAELRYEF